MFLTLAALLLLVVIAAQNYLYPPLRQETISDGLFGPYHWFLDGAYVILATALISAFWGSGLASALAIAAGGCLMVTAITNTFSSWVDKMKPGIHVKLHTWFTIGMFLAMLTLQGITSGWPWLAANIGLPLVAFGACKLFKSKLVPGPVAEKTAVAVLCAWLMSLGL